MKHTRHILLMAAMLLGCFSVSAEVVQIDGIWYDIVKKTAQAEVVRDPDGTYYSGDIVIPSVVEYQGVEYSVTSIGEYALRGYVNNHTGVVMHSITSVSIPESVTSIGVGAFAQAIGISKVYISSIEAWCKISFGDDNHPIAYADSLYLNGKLVKDLVIPKGVTSIGNYAFSGCSCLTSITIPEGVTEIGRSAFRYSSFYSISIPESVTSIGESAFNCCYNLTSVNIPAGITSIESYAFSGCISLTSIKIPEGVTSIGSWAFRGCSNLTEISIPNGLASVGLEAFVNCTNLDKVHISSVEAWCKTPFGSSDSNPLFYAHNLYLNGELVTELVIPEGVTSIGNYAFNGCSSLTSIFIPEGVTSIGTYAFRGCSSLATINFSAKSKLTSIGNSAFDGCSCLTSIFIPEGVTSIGPWAFDGCSSLATINFPTNSKLTSIEVDAFKGCSNLTEISIPQSVTGIKSSTFKDCVKLISVVLPKSLTSIGNKAFANCESLLDVYCYAKQVPSTDESAFENSYPENITLHVPTKSLNDYKATAPWNSFGKFETTIETLVSSITLSETSITLTVGDVWQLSVTEILPEDATDKSVIWAYDSPAAYVDREGKVHAVAPGTGTIYVSANDGSDVCALCEVTVVEAASYSLTFTVDGEVFQTETSDTPIEVVFPEAPEKVGHSFVRWELESSDATLTDIDIKNNADEMLYTNAPCTNTQYGDQFTSWDVLFDNDYSTFFHSEYSEGVDSEDGEHHYLRVDMGEGNSVNQFTFSYAMRGDQFPNHTPTEIIVEGSNEADGEYEVIAVLTDLAEPPYDIDYTSEILGNGKSYRYIRYRVTKTLQNSLVCGHPYFYISEFGMKEAQDCYNAVYHGVYSPNKYKVYYYVGEELLGYVEVTYGDNMPNMGYFPALDTEEFLGWISETGETYSTMPAHDVIYVANIRTYEKCATPTMEYADGRMKFSCETEGVEFRTRVIDENRLSYRTDSDGFEFVPTYTFTTRATKEDCIDSEEVSITICWIDCTGEHENGNDDTGIISVPSQPVIIQCANGVITLAGLANGTAVVVNDTAGMEQGTAEVENGVATIATNLTAGSTAIVKMGNRSVKVMIK